MHEDDYSYQDVYVLHIFYILTLIFIYLLLKQIFLMLLLVIKAFYKYKYMANCHLYYDFCNIYLQNPMHFFQLKFQFL